MRKCRVPERSKGELEKLKSVAVLLEAWQGVARRGKGHKAWQGVARRGKAWQGVAAAGRPDELIEQHSKKKIKHQKSSMH